MKADEIRDCIATVRQGSVHPFREEKAFGAEFELTNLEAENAAMREALMVELGEWKRMVLVGDDEDALSERAMHVALIEHALTPDSGKVLMSAPELMLLRDTIRELLDVQNGCPLPKYQEMFDAANEQALVMESWLDDRLK